MPQHVRVRRSVLVNAAVVTIVALPLSLTACAPSADTATHAAELRAPAGSDLLDSPAERVFDADQVRLLSIDRDAGAGVSLPLKLAPEGFMVFRDGVITAAELQVDVPGASAASFTLTEPLILRRNSSGDGAVAAIGTLMVGGVERPNTSVRIEPSLLDEGRVEFVVRATVPESLITASGSSTSVTARISFDAR